MAQFKAQTTNTNNVWNASKRYKINSVVTHSGIEYLNITGSNSLPTLGNDWLVCRQPIGPTYTQTETDSLLLAKLSKNPAEYTVATLPLTGTELALVEQGGTFKKVKVNDLASNKLDKVTTRDVEKVYIKNADGTQGMKPVSELLSEILITNETVTGTYNIDYSAGNVWDLTLTGNTTLTESNAPASGTTKTITLEVSGNHALTYPSGWTSKITGEYKGTATLNTITIQTFGSKRKVLIVQPT